MQRDFSPLKNTNFDLLVIGGGIAGLAVAWDATRRGLKTCVVEASDFGSGASQGCFKIVHGGLRYLQHLDFSRLNRSVLEQRTLRKIAPHLIEPLPIMVPCYGYGMKGCEALRAGLLVYELLSRGRNKGVDERTVLPNHKILSKKEVLELSPKITQEGLRGGVIFYDGQMTNCDRLTLSFGLSAAQEGATLLNYTRAISAKLAGSESRGRKICSVQIEDVLTGMRYDVNSRFVVDATGVWSKATQILLGAEKVDERPQLFSKGIQIVIPKQIVSTAVAVESPYRDSTAQLARGSRSYFLVPWRSATLIGTADFVASGDADGFAYTEDEVKGFVDEVRQMYPEQAISSESVTSVFGGMRPPDPAAAQRFETGKQVSDEEVGTAKEDFFRDFSMAEPEHRVENLISVAAVKYTTGRHLAERVVDSACARLGVTKCCDTESAALAGAPSGSIESFEKELFQKADGFWSKDTARDKLGNYGARALDILEMIKSDANLAEVIDPVSQLSLAEVAYVVRNEMAMCLEDVVFRRTPLAATAVPDDSILEKIASFMASELSWDEVRKSNELDSVVSKRWAS